MSTEEETLDELESSQTNNEEIYQDVQVPKSEKIIVYSRDWTIETVLSQIAQENVDLQPNFQRRTAWKDDKKSRLIESYILGLPVPEIVFAEDMSKPKSFIVIDGKQRLLTVAGFAEPEKYKYWEKPILRGLKGREDLNDLDFQKIKNNVEHKTTLRQLMNADVRCTIISNYKSPDVLYDIFYRLNTGSEPLSTQELRQVLSRGPFSQYLFKVTNNFMLLHKAMGLKQPDNRLYDVEFVLRYLLMSMFGDKYTGNLKQYLDDYSIEVNEQWPKYQSQIESLFAGIDQALTRLAKVFSEDEIGRRFSNKKYYHRYNKAILESLIYCFYNLKDSDLSGTASAAFKTKYEQLFDDPAFVISISGSTKDTEKYRTRFRRMIEITNSAFSVTIPPAKILSAP